MSRSAITRSITAVGLVSALTLALAACGNDASSSSTPTVTVTATAPPTGTSLPASAPLPTTSAQPTRVSTAPTPTVPATAGGGKCVDTTSAPVTKALASLGMFKERPYVAMSSTPEALGSCPAMMWVLSTIQGATASSPYHVLFFDINGYLGTATKPASVYTSIVGHSATAVDVQYRWLMPDNPSCCPQGGPVTVRFTLSPDGTVTPNREIPPQALPGG